MAKTTERVVVIRGLKLHTQRRSGSARPPLLLLHGIGGSLDSWAPLLAALPERDIVMIDSPGAGRSDVPLLPMRITAVADHVADALRNLGIASRVDVLGYSLGALVAQALAHNHSALVRRLVLVGAIMDFSGPPPKPKVHRAMMSTQRYNDPAAADRDVAVLAGGQTARDPVVRAAIIADRRSHAPTSRGYRYQQLSVIGWNSSRWLPDLRMPTLVLHGEDDPVVHVSNARKVAGRIPKAELEIVPGAGHMLLFDEPTKSAAILERFLAR